MKAIDPSEIITGEPPRPKPSTVNPWIRCAARLFDYALFFFLLSWVSGKAVSAIPFENWVPLEFFAWVPLEALLLWIWGTTPGKWLLRTHLKKGLANKLDFESALRRGFSVWVRGMGLGIPILNVLCMLASYHRLRVLRTTSWDLQEKIAVFHEGVPKWRFYCVFALAIIGLIYYSYWKKSL